MLIRSGCFGAGFDEGEPLVAEVGDDLQAAAEGFDVGGQGAVWELRIRLRDVAARIAYWCTAEGTIVLLTVFRKTRQHDQKQIDRAVRTQKACKRDHRGPAAETYERQV
jgi:phage-related protein